MTKVNVSAKHIQINKASTIITATVAIASFICVASLVASRTMLLQRNYQAKVIKEKELAVKTLKDNIKAVDSLEASYQAFVKNPVNIIGGSSIGDGERDGDNAKLILDALPSKYDFPALATSVEKILRDKSFAVVEITGTDDELAQASKDSPNPEVIEMPFSFTIGGGYDAMHDLISALERSIRPIQISRLTISADSGSGLQLTIDAKTFYQSEKKFNVQKKVIK